MAHATVLSILWVAVVQVLEDAECSMSTQQLQELRTLLRFFEDDLREYSKPKRVELPHFL